MPDPQQTVAEIFALLEGAASHAYFGEPVTQLEHALQAADHARSAGGDDEEVLAALLHDIGHLLGEAAGEVGVPDHDAVARPFLQARGFSSRLVDLVCGHVDAKRYLTAANPEYWQRLSEASRQTLELQGGPMSPEEMKSFAAHPHRDGILRLRVFDERAKEPGARVAPLEDYREMLLRHLSRQQG